MLPLETGGAFDRPEPPGSLEQVGTAVLKFESCTEAEFAYRLEPGVDGEEERTGQIQLERLSPAGDCVD